ncbi:MAG: hypothetical protein N4A62_13480 [Marinisporobacter sp.]|jgi:hypothetical protein|nr:hypothetical protein [Marinisporobacter sp.]
MKIKKIMFISIQLLLGIISSYCIIFTIPYYGWSFVNNALEIAARNSGNIVFLLGERGPVDLGTFGVAVVYIVPILLISNFIIRKTKFRAFGITFCIGSIVMPFIIFALMSV